MKLLLVTRRPRATKSQQADHGRQLNVEATLNSVVVLG